MNAWCLFGHGCVRVRQCVCITFKKSGCVNAFMFELTNPFHPVLLSIKLHQMDLLLQGIHPVERFSPTVPHRTFGVHKRNVHVFESFHPLFTSLRVLYEGLKRIIKRLMSKVSTITVIYVFG